MTDLATINKANGADAPGSRIPGVVTRPRGKPFVPGNSGRPAGARNKLTVLAEQLMADDAEAIVRKVISMALAGDLGAAKLILDRILPVPKSRPVEIALRAVGEHDGEKTIVESYGAVVAAVAAGQVSPAEGLELFALIGQQHAALSELAPHRLQRERTREEVLADLVAAIRAETQRRQAAEQPTSLQLTETPFDPFPDLESQKKQSARPLLRQRFEGAVRPRPLGDR
jgi:hypothetical protein